MWPFFPPLRLNLAVALEKSEWYSVCLIVDQSFLFPLHLDILHDLPGRRSSIMDSGGPVSSGKE